MKPLIFDATPLIYLTRIGLADLLKTLPAPKFAPRSVFIEVVERGREKGHADALALARLFEAKAINIIDPSEKGILSTLRKVRGLEQSDAETLAIAKDRDYRAVLDDLLARRVATTYAIDFVGTPFILLLATQSRLITKQDALRAVDGMIEAGWRCGPEVYREIIRMIETAGKGQLRV
jgi:predicted nucleic acid-binding protein